MFKVAKLSNKLTLITVDLPQLESATTLIAVPAGSRYETRSQNGISHFLEHMFFKGSKKYPSTEVIANMVDGIGAVNNAATSKEWTYYWIKSSSKHIDLASDVIASMIKEPLFDKTEIEREKGVIVEELRMYRDNPMRYIWDLYEKLQFGDQPLGWDVGGDEETVNSITRADFQKYVKSLYDPSRMVLVYAGKLPTNIKSIAEKHFSDLPEYKHFDFSPYQPDVQTKPRVNLFYKKTDQANLVLGVRAFDRHDPRRYATKLLGTILGGGMSSRLFMQVRERRGLAYTTNSGADFYVDTGLFACFAGLKLEKVEGGLQVILDELHKLTETLVDTKELQKAKEMERGHLSLRSESTNFLAEHFATEYLLDREIEPFEEYLKQIDRVTAEDIRNVAKELFVSNRYNLQIISPRKDTATFLKILQTA